MKRYIMTFDNVLTRQECNDIVNRNKSALDESKVGLGANKPASHVRISSVMWLDNLRLKDAFTSYVKKANTEEFGFDVDYGDMSMQLTHYNAAREGFYKYHIDTQLTNDNHKSYRKLTAVIQLSDPKGYTGGRLQFITPEVTGEEPRILNQGQLIIFPSMLTHQVTPVTGGERFSVVGWFKGPQFK